MSLNKVHLIGRLGKDAELTHTSTGLAVLKATIATSERFKDKDGKYIEKSEWHRLAMFSKRAEGVAPYLKKGTQVYVEGKIQTTQYEKDGVKHFSTDIIVNDIILLGIKEKAVQQEFKHPDQEQFDKLVGNMRAAATILGDSDNIPF